MIYQQSSRHRPSFSCIRRRSSSREILPRWRLSLVFFLSFFPSAFHVFSFLFFFVFFYLPLCPFNSLRFVTCLGIEVIFDQFLKMILEYFLRI